MSFDPNILAERLAGAWQRGGTISLPELSNAPASREEACAVQDRFAELIDDEVTGWKVAGAVKILRERDGHDAPFLGRVFRSRSYTSPASIAVSSLQPTLAVEIEIVLALRRDVGSIDEIDGLSAADFGFMPGVELIGSRYEIAKGGRHPRTFDIIADNANGVALLLGQRRDEWSHLDYRTLPLVAEIDGSPLEAFFGEYRRDPMEIARETLHMLAARGTFLAEGDIISTGSLTVPTPVKPGQTVTARIGDLPELKLEILDR